MRTNDLRAGGAGFRWIGIPPAAVVLALAGCSQPHLDGYDPQFRYELRTDPIVTQPPPAAPTKNDLPRDGKINEFLRGLRKLGGKVLDPATLDESTRTKLRDLLDDRFGTPANPKTPTDEPDLGLDPATLAAGSASYRARCTQCHGISGDARGPTGPFVNPLPRDFRSGQYKRSTAAALNGKPRLDDLVAVLRQGVSGTSMPMFDLLSDADLHALSGYVVHLSVRGEVELIVLRDLLDEDAAAAEDLPRMIDTAYSRVVAAWKAAQVPQPPVAVADSDDPDSIRRGHAVFLKAGCAACHANYGNTETFRYDLWGFPNAVTNLRQPERRWGHAPHELANTVRRGIPPAFMPAAALDDADLADLVHFLRALPYPAKLPGDVRSTVEGAR